MSEIDDFSHYVNIGDGGLTEGANGGVVINSIRILIIDDYEDWRDTIAGIFKDGGLKHSEISVASDVKSAELALALYGHSLQVVTLDQELDHSRKRSDGDTLVPIIRNKAPNALIVGIAHDSIQGADIQIAKFDGGDWEDKFRKIGVFAKLGL